MYVKTGELMYAKLQFVSFSPNLSSADCKTNYIALRLT